MEYLFLGREGLAVVLNVFLVAFLLIVLLTRRRRSGEDGVEESGKTTIYRNVKVAELAEHSQVRDLWLSVHGFVIDVTLFVDHHPGGSMVLLKVAGRDAGSEFDDAGHTTAATKQMKHMAFGKLEVEAGIDVQAKRSRCRLRRLFTNEDPTQKHKIIGMLCMIHFMIRLGRHIGLGGFSRNLGFGPDWLALMLFWLHVALQLSSFQFHLPLARAFGKPMLWQEFRMHNTIFVLRHVICCTIMWLTWDPLMDEDPYNWFDYASNKMGIENRITRRLLCFGVVFAAMFLADEASKRLRDSDHESTTATMPYWDGCPVLLERTFKRFYALSQFMATLAAANGRSLFIRFICIFPIQISSFLMTLVRKSIISTQTYHIMYFWTLAVVWLCFFLEDGLQYQSPLFVCMLYFLRSRGLSKYALWSGVAVGAVIGDVAWHMSRAAKVHRIVFYGFVPALAFWGSMVAVWLGTASFAYFFGGGRRHQRYLESRPKPVKLLSRCELSEALELLRFGLPQGYVCGVRPGQHVQVHCANVSHRLSIWNGTKNAESDYAVIKRSYTPISSSFDSTIDLIVRRYPPDAEMSYPHGGRASEFLCRHLAVHSSTEMAGPIGKSFYDKSGIFWLNAKRIFARKCVAVVGGSGITPILQLLAELQSERCLVVEVYIIHVTKCSKQSLIDFIMKHPEQLMFSTKNLRRYCVAQTDELAASSTPTEANVTNQAVKLILRSGTASQAMIEEEFPQPADDVVAMVCGPLGFTNHFYTLMEGMGFQTMACEPNVLQPRQAEAVHTI